jgi:hypothetical protein
VLRRTSADTMRARLPPKLTLSVVSEPSFCEAVLTGIYLCSVCACHELLRRRNGTGSVLPSDGATGGAVSALPPLKAAAEGHHPGRGQRLRLHAHLDPLPAPVLQPPAPSLQRCRKVGSGGACSPRARKHWGRGEGGALTERCIAARTARTRTASPRAARHHR